MTGLPESGFDRYLQLLRSMGETSTPPAGTAPVAESPPRPSVFTAPDTTPAAPPARRPARRPRHRDETVDASPPAVGPTLLPRSESVPGSPAGPEPSDWLEVTAPAVPVPRRAAGNPPDRRPDRRPGPARDLAGIGLTGLGVTGLSVVASLVLICVAAVAAFVVIARWQQPDVVREGVTTSSAVVPTTAPATPAVPPTRAPGPRATVRLGVFRGTSSGQVYGFERWLGRDVDYVVDFTRRASWNEVADPHEMIAYWAGTRYRLVVSTPLLAEDGRSTMAAGARGHYDRYYRSLARNLVKGGQPDAIIRLGWEFNLGSSKWKTGNPVSFIAYWRRIVTAMRSVPGQHFRFDWNVNVGETSYDGAAYYPGGRYVDYVGVDVYDVSWDPQTYPYPASCDSACRLPRQKRVWQRLYGGQHGLAYWSDFARSKGKPLSLPEWGLWGRTDGHGGTDDPYFIRQMYRFVADPANNVAYQAYFEANLPNDRHSLRTSFPKAAATFRTLFGKK